MKRYLLVLGLLLFLWACDPIPTSDPDAARTAAAQTLDAQLEVAQAEIALLTSQADQRTLEAQLEALETANAIASLEASQTAAAQATFEAIPPQLIAPGGANCRIGPNATFARVTEIPASAATAIDGRSLDGNLWRVPLSDAERTSCWVFWARDLDFLGDVFNLPLVEGPTLPTNTPAPTKAPGFSLRYVLDNKCEGTDFAMVEVRNNGVPLIEQAPRAGVTQAIMSLAGSLSGGELSEEEAKDGKGGWLSFWQKSKSK